ncbi:cytosolic carboxypeptidase 6-like isoform X1 [Oryctolagus cuniculus]|uniref:cytosolic carboxypeptidase 6-like isoform X1 n=1 Tax=Oryctolagus cuniculus TaxID=9986 RepID=UPI003879D101
MAERSQTAPEADSDLGNDDAIGGNVSKHAVLPVGYCGQLKKGHLVFDACFESGNLGRVDQVSEFEYDLFIRPDTCNPRFRVWFNFTVENVRESQVRNIMGCVKCGFGKKNMLLFSLRKIKIMAVLVIYSCYLLPMIVLFQ